ncbi:MAG: L-rhamnose isomerase [Christensenellales bacterium]|jgi:L-rhamnose isomerase
MKANDAILTDYQRAKVDYMSLNVNTDDAINILKGLPLSIHCWQGDDVTGFETEGSLTGGIMATGNYPGKARSGDELRDDIDKAFSLIPGKKKVNLHAMYAEFNGKKADRDEIDASHFSNWISWAKSNGYGLDFNPTIFSHKMFKDNLSLTHPDKKVRRFWIEHCKRTREIGAEFGKQLGQPCVNNVWVADGMKDMTADRMGYRQRLFDSLDEVFEIKYDQSHLVDAVESKLFGIGSESFVPGSFEFYLGYAIKNNIVLCLDSGHFHPTETIADKISAVLIYLEKILLHVSRGLRWDSDHVAALTDDTKLIARECIHAGMDRVYCALDYFDASINRIAAWTIGARAFLKAVLIALLEPAAIRQAEENFDYTTRLALMEEAKQLPFGAVWDRFCIECGVPAGSDWLTEVKRYEQDVLSKR